MHARTLQTGVMANLRSWRLNESATQGPNFEKVVGDASQLGVWFASQLGVWFASQLGVWYAATDMAESTG